MKPIPSTAEILAFRMLGRSVEKKWVDWAYDMLVAGFENENLVMLAGEHEPYSQSEIQRLTDKVFAELGLTWDDKDLVIRNYVCYLVSLVLEGKKEAMSVLYLLMQIYSKGYEGLLHDFAMLYWAKDDLDYDTWQNYWPGATRENIDAIILRYFREWKVMCD